jgi:cell fate regulator YaaT (PSP1 superfamily)
LNPEDTPTKPDPQPAGEPAGEIEATDAQAGEERPKVPSRVAGVVLADGKVAEFDSGDLDLSVGDNVVVDNERDLNLGRVVFLAQDRKGKTYRPVLRRVGPEDFLLIRRNKKREEEAFEFCLKRIKERDLPMKLIRVAYLHGGNKAIFYFSAEGRVDFRILVRDLAQQLHVRIEMRQIGVRDESKMLGGVGICGQSLCCARFLRKFVPVSIKMAKNQNLALNPQKLSGLCGRLMCCLVYEDESYLAMKKDLPKVGATIQTPRGEGKILDVSILERKLRIQMESGVISCTIEDLQNNELREEQEEARSARFQERREMAPANEKRGVQQRSRDSRQRQKRGKKPAEQSPADAKPAEGKQAADKSKRKKRRRRRRRKKKPQGGPGGSGSGNP